MLCGLTYEFRRGGAFPPSRWDDGLGGKLRDNMKTHTYALEQRLRLIDFLLAHYGTVNRSALMDYFAISTPQASLDIQEYIRIAPGNAWYDKSAKTYCRSAEFKRKYP